MGESSSSRSIPTERSQLSHKKKKYPELDPQETYGTLDETHNEPTLNDTQRNKKLCTYIILFITIITTLVIFIILWFAPTFAERTVKENVQFKFQTASILNVSKDNTMSLHVGGQIKLEPKLFSWYESFSSMFGQVDVKQTQLIVMHIDQKIGTIGLPAMSLNASSASTEFDFMTQFIIQDSNAFKNFCKQAVEASKVVWHITGPLSVQLGWTPFISNVELDKDIELDGMNGLKKTEMQQISFPGANPLGGVSIAGTVGLFNPSEVLSLRLGNVDFGIYLPGIKDDIQIAVVRAKDANLQGNHMNYFNVTGRTLPFSEDTQEPLSAFLSSYLHGESSLVHVRGSSYGPDPNNPTSTPGWLQEALEAVTIQVPFPGAAETDLIQDMDLSHIRIDFSSQNPVISADVTAYLKKPKEFNFDLNVTEIKPTVFLYLNRNSVRPFATVQSNAPCPSQTYKMDEFRLVVKSKIEKAPFKVLPGGQKDFEEFLQRVFYEKKGKVYIKGKSDAKVNSAFGNISVHDLEFNGVIEIQGMQGLGEPQIMSIALVKGFKDALEIKTALKISNPSNAAVDLGNLQMALLFNNHIIGKTFIHSLALDANSENDIQVSAWLQGNNPHVVDFIGQYISTDISSLSDVNLTISGDFPDSTSSEWLRPLISQLKFSVKVPPFDKDPILADCLMNILSSTTIMSLRNPFPGMLMTINNINASATYNLVEIGDMVANFEDAGEGWKNGPMVLPSPPCESGCGGIVVESEKIQVKTKKMGLDAIKNALGGSIVISVESKVGLLLGDYRLDNLLYIQNNITAKVRTKF